MNYPVVSTEDELLVNYLLNDFEHDLTMISISSPAELDSSLLSPVCLPEGEKFDKMSSCVSISLLVGDSFSVQSEVLSTAQQSSCDRFKQTFEQINRVDLSGTICSGLTQFNSQCRTNAESSTGFENELFRRSTLLFRKEEVV